VIRSRRLHRLLGLPRGHATSLHQPVHLEHRGFSLVRSSPKSPFREFRGPSPQEGRCRGVMAPGQPARPSGHCTGDGPTYGSLTTHLGRLRAFPLRIPLVWLCDVWFSCDLVEQGRELAPSDHTSLHWEHDESCLSWNWCGGACGAVSYGRTGGNRCLTRAPIAGHRRPNSNYFRRID